MTMKIVLSVLGTLMLLLGIYQGCALANTVEPLLEGYVGGIIPIVCGILGTFCFVQAKNV